MGLRSSYWCGLASPSPPQASGFTEWHWPCGWPHAHIRAVLVFADPVPDAAECAHAFLLVVVRGSWFSLTISVFHDYMTSSCGELACSGKSCRIWDYWSSCCTSAHSSWSGIWSTFAGLFITEAWTREQLLPRWWPEMERPRFELFLTQGERKFSKMILDVQGYKCST